MTTDSETASLRCGRCGRQAQAEDKFCAECLARANDVAGTPAGSPAAR